MIDQNRFDNFTKFLQLPRHEVQGKVPGVIGAGSIGWQTLESRQRLMEMLDMNIRAFMSGKPVNVVN